MHVDGATVGALNVYDAAPRTWTDEEVTAARLLADMATAIIVMAGQLRSAEQLAAQLQHAPVHTNGRPDRCRAANAVTVS